MVEETQQFDCGEWMMEIAEEEKFSTAFSNFDTYSENFPPSPLKITYIVYTPAK